MSHRSKIIRRSRLLIVLAIVFFPGGQLWCKEIIAEQLRPFVDKGLMAGAVTAVATKTRIVDLEAVGYADILARTPMKTDTMFWIASMSKPIAGTALMMLVDEGKISLDDPVGKYLPEFNHLKFRDGQNLQEVTRPMTIRDCLSHSSGLPYKSPSDGATIDLLPLRETVRGYAGNPLSFAPGARYQYTNAGMNTVAAILEVVTGQPYDRFLEERIFRPLGMKDTTFWPTKDQLARLAKSYKPTADKGGIEEVPIIYLQYPLDSRSRQPNAGGGLFSTASDVARFGQMILNGGELDGKRYLSKEAVQEMTRRQTCATAKETYGLGWSLWPTKGGVFGHSGAYCTNLTIDPPHGLVTVFMVQSDGWRNDEAKKAQPTFAKEAIASFGK